MNEQRWYVGIDIGGTKSAVLLANDEGEMQDRIERPTTKGKDNWLPTIDFFKQHVRRFIEQKDITSIGISCGGPLNTQEGLICSPPNLPGWDDIPIVDILTEEFKLPVALQNDANAGALAEWRFGAGKGHSSVIFLTFGTGLGAGLILDGKLYAGANGNGGEAGHIRLDATGPIGYNKRGSFEGFCSGTGLAQMMGFELLCLKEQIGEEPMMDQYKEPGKITGKDVHDWAQNGDSLARQVVQKSGDYFGKGLAILIDLFNPEIIVVGGMAVRLGDLLLDPAREVVRQEALPGARSVCEIVPAALEENIGDMAALCVAMEAVN